MVIRAEVGQLAFQAFDIEPQRAAMAEQQQRTAAGGGAGTEFDADQFKQDFWRFGVDIARLAGRSNRSAAISRRGEVSPASVCSQSSRFSPITSRFSPCRQMMSEVWTRASCTCAEITARSSASSAISLSGAFNAASSDIAVSTSEI
jgi:hypothetical protein